MEFFEAHFHIVFEFIYIYIRNVYTKEEYYQENYEDGPF